MRGALHAVSLSGDSNGTVPIGRLRRGIAHRFAFSQRRRERSAFVMAASPSGLRLMGASDSCCRHDIRFGYACPSSALGSTIAN
jgi:hypothetical protein